MPNIEISQFETFKGETGNDVFFAIASGGANKIQSDNYKIPFGDLKPYIGVSPQKLDIFSADNYGIYFGGITAGDLRTVSVQRNREDVGAFDLLGNLSVYNLPESKGSISGNYVSGITGNLTEQLLVSGIDPLSVEKKIHTTTDGINTELQSLSGSLDIFSGQHLSNFSALSSDIGLMGQSILSIPQENPWGNNSTSQDIHQTKGGVGIANNLPLSDLDVSGDVFCSKIKVGAVSIYTDANGNLVFDWG